mmetsp:Transcript_23915/g.73236  ORF Transcript_23915/g.73236 Transcript_23915/m.73236 type:complete len:278 (-) Transcript_23915:64-897(-)|eukprot:scaffold232417_cov32-Tisochrysis_lutea.AAC.3
MSISGCWVPSEWSVTRKLAAICHSAILPSAPCRYFHSFCSKTNSIPKELVWGASAFLSTWRPRGRLPEPRRAARGWLSRVQNGPSPTRSDDCAKPSDGAIAAPLCPTIGGPAGVSPAASRASRGGLAQRAVGPSMAASPSPPTSANNIAVRSSPSGSQGIERALSPSPPRLMSITCASHSLLSHPTCLQKSSSEEVVAAPRLGVTLRSAQKVRRGMILQSSDAARWRGRSETSGGRSTPACVSASAVGLRFFSRESVMMAGYCVSSVPIGVIPSSCR